MNIVQVDIESLIFDVVHSVTGHSTEDLDQNLYLEGDLGLDSIKLVSLMNSLLRIVPEDSLSDFTDRYPVQELMKMQTLGDIIQVFKEWAAYLDSAAGRANEPVVDPAVNFLENSEEINVREIEVLNSQYPFLISHGSIGTLTICSSIRIKGFLDTNILWKSWKELIGRHPVLMMRFEIPAGVKSFRDYKQIVISEATPPDIEVNDISHLDQKARSQIIGNKIEQLLNNQFAMDQWPLQRFLVMRINDQEHEIILVNHHIIVDGLGQQQILREFLEIYGARSQGKKPDLPPPTSIEDYNSIVRVMNAWDDPKETKKLEDYLKIQGNDKYFWNPTGKKSTSSLAQTKKLRYELGKKYTDLLISRTSHWRVSLFTLIVSAYIKTIKKIGEKSNIIVMNLPTSGKLYPNADASDYVGCFAQNLAINFNIERPDESWETVVPHVAQQIRNAISAGIDRAQIKQTAIAALEYLTLEDGKLPEATASLVRSAIKSNLYISFIGQTNIENQFGPIDVLDYAAYTSTNAGTVDNLIQIFQDNLQITSNYDSTLFDEAFIDVLMQEFIANMKDLASFKIKADSSENGFTSETIDEMTEAQLYRIVEEVCHRIVTRDDFCKGLEAELGIDSLKRIRIISRLSKSFTNLNKELLFECRTLGEMVFILSGQAGKQEEFSTDSGTSVQIPYMQIVEQCVKTPDAVAIFHEGLEVGYGELHRLSNRVANYLRGHGIRPGCFVGIMTRPGTNMLIGMLGTLKAGGAYVPVDPDYPAGRIKYILDNAKVPILITEHVIEPQLRECIEKELVLKTLVFLDEDIALDIQADIRQVKKREWTKYPDSDPDYINSPNDLMNLLYTSGSTGNPKGVMTTHAGYMNRLAWHQKQFQLQAGERVAQKTSCCFDISVWELFWPLMVGGVVCPARKKVVKNPWGLAQWLNDARINIMHFVPSLFGEFVRSLKDEAWTFPHLRWLIFSGEILPVSVMQRWINKHGMNIGLANLYGPTEASIDVTYHIIQQQPGSMGETSIPIGKPVDNTYIMILDKNMKPLPKGEIGELWIGGIQLAKGYYNKPEKTSEAFHPNPFPEVPGDRIYRSGDLAAELADGTIEYHGRIDNQVKIRGFRIELGEIESVLTSHPAVDEAAVILVAYGSEEKQLVAWLSGDEINDKKIKGAISNRLPHYMIPHRIEWLPSLPKTPNGKLDRKALLAITKGKGQSVASTVPASTGKDLPLGPAQRWLMRFFDPPYQWTGYTRFFYHQPLDVELFAKAIATLLQRHPILRLTLVQKNSTWRQHILSEEAIDTTANIAYYDASHLTTDQRNREVHELMHRTAHELRIDQWPLWKVFVLKASDSLYDISMVGHHLISDVLSNRLMLQDVWQVYGQLLAGLDIAVTPPGESYEDFVLLLEKEEKNGTLASHVEYWKSRFPSDASAFQFPKDLDLGPNIESSAASKHFALNALSSNSLRGKAKKHFSSNVYPILLAPLYKMLAEWTAQPGVVVSHRLHGRDLGNGRAFFHAVGNFAVNCPLAINVGLNDGWCQLIRKIQDGFSRLPMNGITYDQVAEHLPSYMYPDMNLTPIRANYLGDRDTAASNVLKFVEGDTDRRFSPPGQKRISVLEFFFSIKDKKLNLEIEYSKNLHHEVTIERLGSRYIELMSDLIYSVQSVRTEHAESPFTYSATPSVQVGCDSRCDRPLSGRIAIITGGGGGIGRAISLNMAKNGAKTVLVARSKDHLDLVADEIRQQGGQVLTVPADVTSYEEVVVTVNRVINHFGKIDILVNNAGITEISGLIDSDPTAWRRIVEVNLFGTYNFCHAVVPHLMRTGAGKIINIGSDSSFIGYPLFSAYASSKHGILGLTKSLSEELKPYNIQVNAVCPAMVDTDMAPPALRGRAIAPENVADVALFLASKHSDSVTGEAIRVYGKQDMYWFGSQQMTLLKATLSKNVTVPRLAKIGNQKQG